MILGDNGNIYRIVGVNGTSGGAYLAFNYDALDPDRGDLRIIPRAAELLDYTPGGPDYGRRSSIRCIRTTSPTSAAATRSTANPATTSSTA
jgi:hypothetical protein